MNYEQALRNVRLYGFFQALREPLFWGPVVIFFMQHAAGMPLADIYVMEAVAVALLFILEVPSGALADVVGRRKTILWGSLLLLGDTVLFGLASSPAMVWSANMLWACGAALVSGADSSFLYDSLAAVGRQAEFKKVQGRSRSYLLVLLTLGSAVSGYLAEVNLHLPILLGIPGQVVVCLVVFFFKEPPRSPNGYSLKHHWNLMKLSVLFVANHKRVKWIILFVVFTGVVSKLWFFTYNPYFELVGLPLQYFGWIFFGMNIVAAYFSFSADWWSKKLPVFASLVLVVFFNSVPLVLMALFVSAPMVLLILLENVSRGYLAPFMDHFLHEYLSADKRATVVSVQSAARGLVQFAMLGLFGLALKVLSLNLCLLLLGIAASLVGSLILVKYKKVFR